MGQSVYTRILTCGGGDQFTDIFVVVVVCWFTEDDLANEELPIELG